MGNKSLDPRPWLLAILMMAVPALAVAGARTLSFEKPVQTGIITDPELSEVSGIFAAKTSPSRLFAVNDSGNAPDLFALRPDGTLAARYRIQGAQNTDWEDLSGFTGPDGENYLVIGDVGDNFAIREHCTLFIVKEPDPRADKYTSLPVLRQIRFRYQDGPRDCEAVAVDAPGKRILLLSKRERHPVLYELPLFPEEPADLAMAIPIGTIRTLPQPTEADLRQKHGDARSWPTAMDLTPDGRTLIILTYKDAYMFHRTQGRTWDQAFQSPPAPIPLPGQDKLAQRESLCLDPGTGRLFITTEKLPAPIFTLEPGKALQRP